MASAEIELRNQRRKEVVPESVALLAWGTRVTICCGLARPRYLAGAKPAQVTASHGPGIETCSQCGNVLVDA